jgi:hypothetical protein
MALKQVEIEAFKDELMDFMAWMAIHERHPWENYEEVVSLYLQAKADGWKLRD